MIFEFERQHRVPDNEFTNDIEYMASMDSAYHAFLQDKYTEQFKQWERKMRENETHIRAKAETEN